MISAENTKPKANHKKIKARRRQNANSVRRKSPSKNSTQELQKRPQKRKAKQKRSHHVLRKTPSDPSEQRETLPPRTTASSAIPIVAKLNSKTIPRKNGRQRRNEKPTEKRRYTNTSIDSTINPNIAPENGNLKHQENDQSKKMSKSKLPNENSPLKETNKRTSTKTKNTKAKQKRSPRLRKDPTKGRSGQGETPPPRINASSAIPMLRD